MYLSVLPIFIFLNYEFLESIAVCFLLLFVSIGCFFLVLAGTYQNALDKILQTGDYTPEQKKEKCFKIKNKYHLLACCYCYFSLLYFW